MSEKTAIAALELPLTQDSLREALRHMGIGAGDTVLVHSSLSRLGYVSGGAPAVVHALLAVLGAEGTLCVPAHSTDLSDPARWIDPPVPESWWPILYETMTPFDPKLTRTRGMGVIAETVRTHPLARRSNHPQHSFAAIGPKSDWILADHSLENSFGDPSPLGRLYDLAAKVLLLGVGHANNTSFHLGEQRADVAPIMTNGAPIVENGARVWKTFPSPDYDSDDFEDCGAAFDNSGHVTFGTIGAASVRLFAIRAAVDFAQAWLAANRAV